MALFDFFKRKKPVNPTTQPHTVILSSENEIRTQPVPSPVQQFQPSPPPQKAYLLTFRDAYTGRSLTDTFPGDTLLSTIIHRLEQENILSFPSSYISIPGVNSLERQGSHFPDVNDIQGVNSGMTLTVDIYQAKDPQLRTSPNLRKTYELVFFRMEEKVCVEKIEFLCYGFEYPSDVVSRMRASDKIAYSYEIGYHVLYWPTKDGLPTLEHPLDSKPLPLCDFDPEPGRIFILQDYVLPPDPFAGYCMYGCPTAALPKQKSILSECCRDLLTFD